MPKFLDAPSWYNVDGLETKANGITFVNIATLDSDRHNLYEKPDGIYVYERASYGDGELKIYVTSGVYLSIGYTPGMQPVIVQKIQCVQTHVWEYYIDGYGYASGSSGQYYSTSSGSIPMISFNDKMCSTVIRVYSNGTATVFDKVSYILNNQYGLHGSKFYAPTTGGTSGQVLISLGSTVAPGWGNLEWTKNEVQIPTTSDIDVADNLQELSFGSYKLYNHNLTVQSTTSTNNMTSFTISIMSTTYNTNVTSMTNLVNLITASAFGQYTRPIPAVGMASGKIMYGLLISTGKPIAEVLVPIFR